MASIPNLALKNSKNDKKHTDKFYENTIQIFSRYQIIFVTILILCSSHPPEIQRATSS